MCYRPINIYNPVRTFNNDQSLRTSVPCGQCEDCQRIMKNEWFFRSYMEFLDYKKRGGYVYFVTLTYDNAHLPLLTLPDGTQVPCFNKFHIRNFIKYIRVWLKRNHMMSNGIKYLICSEYGKNTKRPHYHGLLFFPFYISPLSFTRLVRIWWQHGFVICSREGWEIKGLSGISYASKYVAKDFNYYGLSWAKKLSESGDLKQFVKENYDYMPHHWQSIGYGECFCSVIISQKDIPSFLARNTYQLYNDPNGCYPIPRYYHLKVEKQINKEYSKVLDKVVLERTEIGTKVRAIRLSQSVLKDEVNLRSLTYQHIYNLLTCEDVFLSRFEFLRDNLPHRLLHFENLYYKVYNLYGSFEEMKNTLLLIPELIQTLCLHRLSLYRCFLRFMPLLDEEVPEHKFVEVSDIIRNILHPSVYPPEYADKICPSGLSEFAVPLDDNPHLKKQKLCKDNPYFMGYERVCTLIDHFNILSSITKEFNTLVKRYQKERCKYVEGSKPIIYKSFNT